MRRWRATAWLGILSVAVLTACGPPIQRPDGDDEDGDGTPPECAPGECEPPPSNDSLWPMTVGSSWTYEIDDPIRGKWTKDVRVERVETIPGTELEGTLFISRQPHLVEHSWQIEEEGLAKRVREEDYDPATSAIRRQATWSPLTIKALTEPRDAGWESRLEVVETLTDEEGTDDKHKVFIWRVVEVDAEVTVNGQTYQALKVVREREDKDQPDRIYWLVPGIGKVREEGERTEILSGFHIAE